VLANATGYPEKPLPAGVRLARNPLLRPVIRAWMPKRVVQRSLRQAVGPDCAIVDEAMVTRVHRLWNRPGNRSAFVDFVNTDRHDRSTAIAGISVPTLVLRSAGIDGQQFTRDIPSSREAIHPGGGHLLQSDFLATLVAKRFGRRILFRHLGHNVSDPALTEPLTAMTADCYRYQGSMYEFFSTLQNFPLSARADLFRAAGETGLPTMLLWGADDQVTPITGMDTARTLLRPAQSHVIDCGHMASLERPTEVADHLAAFAATHTDRMTP